MNIKQKFLIIATMITTSILANVGTQVPSVTLERVTHLNSISDCSEVEKQKTLFEVMSMLREIDEVYQDPSLDMSDTNQAWIREHSLFIDINGNTISQSERDGIVFEKVGTSATISIDSIDTVKRNIDQWVKWTTEKKCEFYYTIPAGPIVSGSNEVYTCNSTVLNKTTTVPYYTGTIYSQDELFFTTLLEDQSLYGVVSNKDVGAKDRLAIQHSHTCTKAIQNENLKEELGQSKIDAGSFQILNPEASYTYLENHASEGMIGDYSKFYNQAIPNQIEGRTYGTAMIDMLPQQEVDSAIVCQVTEKIAREVGYLDPKTAEGIKSIVLEGDLKTQIDEYSSKLKISPSIDTQILTNYLNPAQFTGEAEDIEAQKEIYKEDMTVGGVWTKLCRPMEILSTPPSPKGGEAAAAEVLINLGYRDIPQTKEDGDYTLGKKSYDEGLLVGMYKDEGGDYKEIGKVSAYQKYKFQSHFGSFGLGKETVPYLSTGIQNYVLDKIALPAPEGSRIVKDSQVNTGELKSRRIHKFFYETHWEEIRDSLLKVEKDKSMSETEKEMESLESFLGNYPVNGWEPSWDAVLPGELDENGVQIPDLVFKGNAYNTEDLLVEDINTLGSAYYIAKASPYKGIPDANTDNNKLDLYFSYKVANKASSLLQPLLEIGDYRFNVKNGYLEVLEIDSEDKTTVLNKTVVPNVKTGQVYIGILQEGGTPGGLIVRTGDNPETKITITNSPDLTKAVILGTNTEGLSMPGATTNQFYGIIDGIELYKRDRDNAKETASMVDERFINNSGSHNPMVKGYVYQSNYGSDRVTLGLLDRFVKDVRFTFPIKSAHTSSTNGWGDNPFAVKVSGTAQEKTILELYQEGFNWDNQKCRVSGDTECIFAYSELTMGAGNGGHQLVGETKTKFLSGVLNEKKTETKGIRLTMSGEKTQYSGSEVLSVPNTGWLFGSSNGATDGRSDSFSADIYIKMTYDEMKNTKIEFLQDDVGIFLRPGYFYSLDDVNVNNEAYWVSQMKMKRYQRAAPEGIKQYKVLPDYTLQQTELYKTTAKICTDRGLTPETGEDGRIYCKGSVCESDLEFNLKTGSCTPKCKVKEGDVCVDGEFENIGGFGDLDILINIDLSGSTWPGRTEILQYVEGLVATTSSPTVRMRMYNNKPHLDTGWTTNKQVLLDAVASLKSIKGGDQKGLVFGDLLSHLQEIQDPKRRLMIIHAGDNDESGSEEYVNFKNSAGDTGVVGVALSPSTCTTCISSQAQEELASVNDGIHIKGNVQGYKVGDIDWEKILNSILPCKGTAEQCGKKNNKCSLADLEKVYTKQADGTFKKEILPKCNFLATEATSIDVLKQISSTIWTTNAIKDIALDDGLVPELVNGMTIPDNFKEKYEEGLSKDSGTWRRGSDGEVFENLNRSFSGMRTVSIDEIIEMVRNYNIKTSARKNFKSQFGFEMKNLPHFGIDVLNVEYIVNKRYYKDLKLQRTENTTKLISGAELCNYNQTKRDLIYEKIEYTDEEKKYPYRSEWVCASIEPRIDDILEYEIDPFLESRYITYKAEIKGENTSMLYTSGSVFREDFKTTVLLPDGKGLLNSEEESRREAIQEQVKGYIDNIERMNGISSLTRKTLACEEVDTIVENIVVTAVDENNQPKEGFIKGKISCSKEVEDNPVRAHLNTNRFEPTSVESLNTQLEEESPVSANLGEMGISAPYSKCIESTTKGVSKDVELVDLLRVDNISRQVYRTPIALNTNPTIYIPYIETADSIKKEAIRKETQSHTSALIGGVQYIGGEFDRDSEGHVKTNGDGKIGEWLSPVGKDNVATQIENRLVSTYPYEKSKFKIVLSYPRDYKEVVKRPLTAEDLYYTVSVESETYDSVDWTGLEKANITRSKTDNFENSNLRFNDQKTGFLIPREVITNNGSMGKYWIVKDDLPETSGTPTEEQTRLLSQGLEEVLMFRGSSTDIKIEEADTKSKTEVIGEVIKEINDSGCSYLKAKTEGQEEYKEGWSMIQDNSRYVSFNSGVTATEIEGKYVFKVNPINRTEEQKKIRVYVYNANNPSDSSKIGTYIYGTNGIAVGGGLISDSVSSGIIYDETTGARNTVKTEDGKKDIFQVNWDRSYGQKNALGAIVSFDNPIDPARIYLTGKSWYKNDAGNRIHQKQILSLEKIMDMNTGKSIINNLKIDVLEKDENNNIVSFKYYSIIDKQQEREDIQYDTYYKGGLVDENLNRVLSLEYDQIDNYSILSSIGEEGIIIDFSKNPVFNDNQDELSSSDSITKNITVETISSQGDTTTYLSGNKITLSLPLFNRDDVYGDSSTITTTDFFNKEFEVGPLTTKIKAQLKMDGLSSSNFIYQVNGEKFVPELKAPTSATEKNTLSQWNCSDSSLTDYQKQMCTNNFCSKVDKTQCAYETDGNKDANYQETRDYEFILDVEPQEYNEFGMGSMNDHISITELKVESALPEYQLGIILTPSEAVQYNTARQYTNMYLVDIETGSKVINPSTGVSYDARDLTYHRYTPGSFVELVVDQQSLIAMTQNPELLDSCKKTYGSLKEEIQENGTSKFVPNFYMAYDEKTKLLIIEKMLQRVPLYEVDGAGEKITDIRNVKTVILETPEIAEQINCTEMALKIEDGEVFCDRSAEKNTGFEKVSIVNSITGEPDIIFELNDTEEGMGRGQEGVMRQYFNLDDTLLGEGLEVSGMSFITSRGTLLTLDEESSEGERKMYSQLDKKERFYSRGYVGYKNIEEEHTIILPGTGDVVIPYPKNQFQDMDENIYRVEYSYGLENEQEKQYFENYYALVRKEYKEAKEGQETNQIIAIVTIDSNHNKTGVLKVREFEKKEQLVTYEEKSENHGMEKFIYQNQDQTKKYYFENGVIYSLNMEEDVYWLKERVEGYIDESNFIYILKETPKELETTKRESVRVYADYKEPSVTHTEAVNGDLYTVEKFNYKKYGLIRLDKVDGTTEYLPETAYIENNIESGTSSLSVAKYYENEETEEYFFEDLQVSPFGSSKKLYKKDIATNTVSTLKSYSATTPANYKKTTLDIIKLKDGELIKEDLEEYRMERGYIYKRKDPMTTSINLIDGTRDGSNTYRKVDKLTLSKIQRIKSTLIPEENKETTWKLPYVNESYSSTNAFEKDKFISYKVGELKDRYNSGIVGFYTPNDISDTINISVDGETFKPAKEMGILVVEQQNYREVDLNNISDSYKILYPREKTVIMMEGHGLVSEYKYTRTDIVIRKDELDNYPAYKERAELLLNAKLNNSSAQCNGGARVIDGNNVLLGGTDNGTLFENFSSSSIIYSNSARPTEPYKVGGVIEETGVLIKAPEIKRDTTDSRYEVNFNEWTPQNISGQADNSVLLENSDFRTEPSKGLEYLKTFNESSSVSINTMDLKEVFVSQQNIDFFEELNPSTLRTTKAMFVEIAKAGLGSKKIYVSTFYSATKGVIDVREFWVVNSSGSISQYINGLPIAILSKRNYGRGEFNGTIRVQNFDYANPNIGTSGWIDDDHVGFVLGYKDNKNYDRIVWKGAVHSYVGKFVPPSESGIVYHYRDGDMTFNNPKTNRMLQYQQIRNGVTTTQDFESPDVLDPLAFNQDNLTGWESTREYELKIERQKDETGKESINLTIEDKNGATPSYFANYYGTGGYKTIYQTKKVKYTVTPPKELFPGKFGFYNASQGAVEYYNFNSPGYYVNECEESRTGLASELKTNIVTGQQEETGYCYRRPLHSLVCKQETKGVSKEGETFKVISNIEAAKSNLKPLFLSQNSSFLPQSQKIFVKSETKYEQNEGAKYQANVDLMDTVSSNIMEDKNRLKTSQDTSIYYGRISPTIVDIRGSNTSYTLDYFELSSEQVLTLSSDREIEMLIEPEAEFKPIRGFDTLISEKELFDENNNKIGVLKAYKTNGEIKFQTKGNTYIGKVGSFEKAVNEGGFIYKDSLELRGLYESIEAEMKKSPLRQLKIYPVDHAVKRATKEGYYSGISYNSTSLSEGVDDLVEDAIDSAKNTCNGFIEYNNAYSLKIREIAEMYMHTKTALEKTEVLQDIHRRMEFTGGNIGGSWTKIVGDGYWKRRPKFIFRLKGPKPPEVRESWRAREKGEVAMYETIKAECSKTGVVVNPEEVEVGVEVEVPTCSYPLYINEDKTKCLDYDVKYPASKIDTCEAVVSNTVGSLWEYDNGNDNCALKDGITGDISNTMTIPDRCPLTHEINEDSGVCVLKEAKETPIRKVEKKWDSVLVDRCPTGTVKKTFNKSVKKQTKAEKIEVFVEDHLTCVAREDKLSSIRLKTKLEGATEGRMLCDVIDEYLLQGGNKDGMVTINPENNGTTDTNLDIKIPQIQGFGEKLPTILGMGTKPHYNPILLDRFHKEKIFFGLFGEKYWFKHEGWESIASKQTRLLKYHERAFMEQASGTDQVRKMLECTAELGNNGYYNIQNHSFDITNWMTDKNKVKHLIPMTLEVKETGEGSIYKTREYISDIKQEAPELNRSSAQGEDIKTSGYIKTQFLGGLSSSEAAEFCQNITEKYVATGHTIFENTANTMFLEGYHNDNGNQKATVTRVRVLEDYSDSKGNPNWLQSKICRSGYMTTQTVFDREELKNPALKCDNSVYASQCVQEKGSPGVSLFSLIFGSGKAKLKRYFNNIVSMRDTVCGVTTKLPSKYRGRMTTGRNDQDGIFYIMKGHSEAERNSSSSLLQEVLGDKLQEAEQYEEAAIDEALGGQLSTVKFLLALFSKQSGDPLVEKVVETNILLKKHGVDKANMSISMAQNPGESNRYIENSRRVAVFNSVNLRSILTSKKTGSARVLTGTEQEDKASAPDMQIVDQTPLEMLLSECMDWKGEFSYRKPQSSESFEYYTKRSLVKEYMNVDKDYLFTDPRTGKERAVRYCSDIMYNSEETYQSKEKIDPRKARREYVNEMFNEDLDFTKKSIIITEDQKNAIGLNPSNFRMDGGSEVIATEGPGGLEFERVYGKSKERGNEILRDLTTESSLGKITPDIENSINVIEGSLTDPSSPIGGVLDDVKNVGEEPQTVSEMINKIEESIGGMDAMSGLINQILSGDSKQGEQIDAALKVLKTYMAIKTLEDLTSEDNNMFTNTDMGEKIVGNGFNDLMASEDRLAEGKVDFISRSQINTCQDGVCDKQLTKDQLISKVEAFDRSLESGVVMDRSANLRKHRAAVNRARQSYMATSQFDSSSRMISGLDQEYANEAQALKDDVKNRVLSNFNVFNDGDTYRNNMRSLGSLNDLGSEDTRNLRLKDFENDNKNDLFDKMGGGLVDESFGVDSSIITRNHDSVLRSLAGDVNSNVLEGDLNLDKMLAGQDPKEWMEQQKSKLIGMGIQEQKKLIEAGMKFLEEGIKQLVDGVEDLVDSVTEDDNEGRDPFAESLEENNN